MKFLVSIKSASAMLAMLVVLPLLASPVQAYSHPGGFYSQSQIDGVKAKVKANIRPWKPAYDVLIAKAKWLSNEKPSAVNTFYVPGYYSDPAGHVHASSNLQGDVNCQRTYRQLHTH